MSLDTHLEAAAEFNKQGWFAEQSHTWFLSV